MSLLARVHHCSQCPARHGCLAAAAWASPAQTCPLGSWSRPLPVMPPPSLTAPPALTIAALESAYSPPEWPEPASHELFTARLAACRACDFWNEAARSGQGRCNSVACNCSKRNLWQLSEFCPERKWP